MNYDIRLKGRLTRGSRGRDAGYLIFNPNTLEGDFVTDIPDLRGVTAHPMKSFSGIVPDRFPGRAGALVSSCHLYNYLDTVLSKNIHTKKKRYQSNVKIYSLHYTSISTLVELISLIFTI